MSETIHIVLLPGLHGTDDLWAPLLQAIPSHIKRTIVTYPPRQVLTRGQLLDLIEGCLPAAGRLVLVAESFSGPLAIEIAARMPDRLALLVLAATFVSPPWPKWLCHGLSLAARCLFRPMMFVRRCLPNRLMDATIGRAEHDALRHLTPAVLASRLSMVARCDSGEALQRVKAPVLYLAGARDWAVPPRCLRNIQRLRPDVRTVVLPSSHMVLQRCPREARAAIVGALP